MYVGCYDAESDLNVLRASNHNTENACLTSFPTKTFRRALNHV